MFRLCLCHRESQIPSFDRCFNIGDL
jgi:hypothetical protein